MLAVLDGTIKFEQLQLEIGSWERDSAERAVAGLDGVLSIDLGMRGREIVVTGVLRAVSVEAMVEKVDAVSAFMDGQTHVLVAGDGREFANLRVDGFEVEREDYSGRGLCCEFEIRFTQLRKS